MRNKQKNIIDILKTIFNETLEKYSVCEKYVLYSQYISYNYIQLYIQLHSVQRAINLHFSVFIKNTQQNKTIMK